MQHAESRPIVIADALRAGWAGFKPHALTLSTTGAVLAVTLGGFRWAANRAEQLSVSLVLDLAGLTVASLVGLVLVDMALSVVDGRPPTVSSVLQKSDRFVTQAIASLLFWVTTVLGLYLLVIPGVYVMVSYGFYTFVIADQRAGAMAALARAAMLVRGHKWQVLGLGLALLLLNIAGVIMLFVGLAATLGVSAVAGAHVYRSLQAVQTP